MARALIAEGHEVTVVCGVVDTASTGVEAGRGRIARGDVDGIQVIQLDFPYSNTHSLAKRAWNFLRYSLTATRLSLTTSYDVLFATSTPLTAAIPGIVIRRLRRSKSVVFEVRDVWPDLPIALGGLRNPLAVAVLRRLERAAYNSADRTIGLAPGICELIDERTTRDNPPSRLIPNGCDLSLFSPSASRSDPIFRAVFTGTHGVANGLDACLDSAEILCSKGRTDIELHFIGSGNQKAQLIESANARQLENCKFLEPLPKKELGVALHQYDAGLMILSDIPEFYYGTSPNKFFDYIASGLPIVNNYPGWLADLIGEYGCGIAVEPGDPIKLANAIVELADNPAARLEMGRRSRRLAESRFARSDLSAQFVATLEDAHLGNAS
jgi:glycosyltransferase involved in cell wall biosynthesis